MSVGLVLIMLVEDERFAVKPELSVSELVARVDALVVVMMLLGAATAAVEEAVCAGGATVLVGTVIGTSTEGAFATLAFLAVIEVKVVGIEGL